MAATNKTLCLDTNLLFNLAAGLDAAHDTIAALTLRGFRLVITNTVIEELAYKKRQGDRLALLALQRLRSWDIVPAPLSSLDMGIVEATGKAIREEGLLPFAERNDGLIIAESASIGSLGLISSDRHICDIDQDNLVTLLKSKDLPPILIISLWKIHKNLPPI